MAKVMISLPDDLVASVDAEARRRGTTRSGLIRTFAEEAIRRRSKRRSARISQILSEASSHGGQSLSSLKNLRPKR